VGVVVVGFPVVVVVDAVFSGVVTVAVAVDPVFCVVLPVTISVDPVTSVVEGVGVVVVVVVVGLGQVGTVFVDASPSKLKDKESSTAVPPLDSSITPILYWWYDERSNTKSTHPPTALAEIVSTTVSLSLHGRTILICAASSTYPRTLTEDGIMLGLVANSILQEATEQGDQNPTASFGLFTTGSTGHPKVQKSA